MCACEPVPGKVMFTHSQNRCVQKQRAGPGVAAYDDLIIYLQSIFFLFSNSALSKLNFFSQERSTPTGIHRPSPTGLEPRPATFASLRTRQISTQDRPGCLLWSVPPPLLNWTYATTSKPVSLPLPFLPQTVLPLESFNQCLSLLGWRWLPVSLRITASPTRDLQCPFYPAAASPPDCNALCSCPCFLNSGHPGPLTEPSDTPSSSRTLGT